jgi:hypothetical protein
VSSNWTKSRQLITNDLAAGANLMGSDLYNCLIKYLITHLKTLKDVRAHGRVHL